MRHPQRQVHGEDGEGSFRRFEKPHRQVLGEDDEGTQGEAEETDDSEPSNLHGEFMGEKQRQGGRVAGTEVRMWSGAGKRTQRKMHVMQKKTQPHEPYTTSTPHDHAHTHLDEVSSTGARTHG